MNKNNNIEILDYSLDGITQELKKTAVKMELPETLNDLTSGQFDLVLKYTGKRIFKDTGYFIQSRNPITFNQTKCLDIFNIYIDLCNKYNKRISIDGFFRFINSSDGDIYNFNINNSNGYVNGLNALQSVLLKNCDIADNERVMNNATDSKIPVLNLAYNNYKHGWNGTIKSNEIKATVKSLDDIRADRMSLTDGQNP